MKKDREERPEVYMEEVVESLPYLYVSFAGVGKGGVTGQHTWLFPPS